MAAAHPAHGTERGDATSAATGLAACARQRIGPAAGPAGAGTPAAAQQVSARAIVFPILLARACSATSVVGRARVRARPVRTDTPPLRDSIGGAHSLSGSGMLDLRDQLRSPDVPSSFPSEVSLGAGGAVAGRGPATGERP